jgi:four helix bundle protein
VARGSLYEVITFLTIFHEKQWIDDVTFERIKIRGAEIGKMILKLIAFFKKDSFQPLSTKNHALSTQP